MKNRNYNINPPVPTDAEINSTKDFDQVLNKLEVSNAGAKNPLFKNKIFLSAVAGIIVAGIAISLWLNNKVNNSNKGNELNSEIPAVIVDSTTTVSNIKQLSKKKVEPPLPNWDIPFETFEFENKDGGTFISQNGSKVEVKPNSFKNTQNELIDGTIKVKYREFHDPLALFLSGIPMEYDSAGTAYTFESAGMMEIRAEHESNPVELVDDKKINVDLVSLNNDDYFNEYYFDKSQGKWEFLKNSPTLPFKDYLALTKPKAQNLERTLELDPISPKFPKADKDKYSFAVDFDQNKFQELDENVIFEVDEDYCDFDPLYYDVNWETIDLDKSEHAGHYGLNLKKGSKNVKLESYPVLNTDDYKQVMDAYEEALNSKGNKDELTFSAPQFTLSSFEPNETERAISDLVALNTEVKKYYGKNLSIRPMQVSVGITNCDAIIPIAVDIERPELMAIENKVMPKFLALDTTLTQDKIYNTVGKKNALFTNGNGKVINYSRKKNNQMWVLFKNESIGIANSADFENISGEEHDFPVEVYSSIEGLEKIQQLLRKN